MIFGKGKYMELTKSEQKIIEHMKQGLTFRQIAGKAGSGVADICRRVNELYAKFNVCNRVSLLKIVRNKY